MDATKQLGRVCHGEQGSYYVAIWGSSGLWTSKEVDGGVV